MGSRCNKFHKVNRLSIFIFGEPSNLNISKDSSKIANAYISKDSSKTAWDPSLQHSTCGKLMPRLHFADHPVIESNGDD